MKLSELRIQEEDRQGKIRFHSETDKKFYNKYEDKDCVVCYSKMENFPRYLRIIIKTENNFMGLRINNYNKVVIFSEVKYIYKNIEEDGIIIIDNIEINNLKKQLILENLK